MMESKNENLSRVPKDHVMFQLYEREKIELHSATFLSPENDIKWYLKLDNIHEKYHYSIFIVLSHKNVEDIVAEFVASVLNSKYEVLHQLKTTQKFFKSSYAWGWKNFIKKSDLLENATKWLPGDKLTILGEVNIISVPKKAETVEFSLPQYHMLDDFKMLYKHQKLSDVTLAVEGEEFLAHKTILAARSPVFMAMFEHEMKERGTSRVDIRDMDRKVLSEMLHFIYTGEAPHLKTLARGLFVAADKYALERLKLICEKELCLSLYKENVIEMLIMADLHNAEQLKTQALTCISNHASEVMNTSEWKIKMMKHLVIHTDSLYEVMQVMKNASKVAT